MSKEYKKEINNIVKTLKNKYEPEKIILFGSAVKGKTHRWSDIDLLVISPDFKRMEFFNRLLLLTRLRRGMRTTAPMDILGYTIEEFNRLRKESVVLNEAWREGVTIK